ncbi:hypothetical protein AMECASPLE_030260 [Ameca splendens]|uniref:Uncharacterized protein n=1 Tax=Ameca splendens TaxID=208324 RepID=A0ABV0Y6B2_9TELE
MVKPKVYTLDLFIRVNLSEAWALILRRDKHIKDVTVIKASSLITPHVPHLCTSLYKQHTDRQTAPDYRKPLFSSPDHRILHVHWVCKPESSCDVVLRSPDNHIEEPKFSFLSLPRILKRLVALSLRLTLFSVLCLATNLSVCPPRFLNLLLGVSCRTSSRNFNKSFESYLLCLAEISGPLYYLLHKS